MGFLKGWLEGQGIAHRTYEVNGLPSIVAAVGDGPATLIWNAHVDVVPARSEQFSPWQVDGRLYGRGAYDMKGGLAGMLAALADLSQAREMIPGLKVKLLIVPDEESEEDSNQPKSSAFLASEGHLGEFVVCGEPTNLEIGVQAKGVLVVRVDVEGRAAHGSTPWLGHNAVLKAFELYRRILQLPFASGSSELYEHPSINIGRIRGGEVVNIVPDRCRMDVDIRYLPNQSPDEVLRQLRSLGAEVTPIYEMPPATLDPGEQHVRVLREAVGALEGGEAPAVGRHGASDAVFFLERGIPAIEFGPAGGGHHGPEEYVEIESLRRYRRILVEFARRLSSSPNRG
jgi:succinyl-diaminopimelate desuccinylase